MTLLIKYIRQLLLPFLFIMQTALLAMTVVPLPNSIVEKEGNFVFDKNTKWLVEESQQGLLLNNILENFRVASGLNYSVVVAEEQNNAIVFRTKVGFSEEEYAIDITPKKIVVSAANPKGFYYGIQTLSQLLPSELYRTTLVSDIDWQVPCVSIHDKPRFGYRGFMLDVSRHFIPKNDVLDLIDYLALHKINFLHLHLTDDQGWRLEIKKYPKLTDEGAWRAGREAFFSMRYNTIDGEPNAVGGYYSHEDIREMVAYASERFVEIIPEIEMPAHSLAALASYPSLTCPTIGEKLHPLPGMGGDHAAIIYCAGNEKVFDFLQDVIDEVITLFPSQYIHVGGDEAQKEHWEKCPLCQQRIKDENLESAEALQGYFMKRMTTYIQSKGKKTMGWDELVNAEIPKGTTIMGWRGMGLEALKAADQGFPIIMAPARVLYFIRYQGPQWFEPYTYFGNNTLYDVYNYNPTDSMTDKQSAHLKGVQSCLWAEFVRSTDDAEYLIFPRLAAFAETAWTQPKFKDWSNFLLRQDHLNAIYNELDINYAHSMYNLFHNVQAMDGELQVTLTCIRPDVDIRYTLDGSEPNLKSKRYKESFFIKEGETPRAVSFIGGTKKGQILTLNCRFNKATGANVSSDIPNAYILTNGLLGSEKNTDGEYVDLYNKGGVFTLDLLKDVTFEEVELSFINNNGASVFLPSQITISVSDDGKSFTEIKHLSLDEKQRFSKGLFKTEIKLDLSPVQSRFVKIELEKAGVCPQGFIREGQLTRIAMDEVIIR